MKRVWHQLMPVKVGLFFVLQEDLKVQRRIVTFEMRLTLFSLPLFLNMNRVLYLLRQLKSWVQRWDSLATTLGEDGKVGEEYLTHLDKQVTDHFTKRGRGVRKKPNANLINQIRTNEFVLRDGRQLWQMREFAISLVSKI